MSGETPHSVDMEKGLLGSIVKDPTLVDRVGGIDPTIFFIPAHKTIFKHLIQVFTDTGAMDWLMMKESFCGIELEAIGGIEALNEIFDFVPSADNWPHYLELVERNYKRRLAIKACNFISQQAFDIESGADFGSLFERAGKAISFQNNEVEISCKELVQQCIDELLTGRFKHKFYTLSGIHALDAELGGVFPGDMIVIASETSRGKTALGVQMGAHMALGDQRLKVAIFSFEMNRQEICQRIISARAGVRMKAIRYSELNDNEIERLRVFRESVPDNRTIVIEDCFSLTIDGIFSRCRRLKAAGELDAVIVDYLQLVNPTTRSNSNRQQEVAEISRNLKLLAGQLKVLVIGLSQVNEAGAMRESRAIAQDSDIILKIQDDEKSDSTSEREIIIEKNRHGTRGKRVKVDFFGEYVSFANKS
jgi:replicative DNA helicase